MDGERPVGEERVRLEGGYRCAGRTEEKESVRVGKKGRNRDEKRS